MRWSNINFCNFFQYLKIFEKKKKFPRENRETVHKLWRFSKFTLKSSWLFTLKSSWLLKNCYAVSLWLSPFITNTSFPLLSTEMQDFIFTILWWSFSAYPAGIYLLKVNNGNNRTRGEICLKSTIKTPERRQSSSVFFVNFEHVIAGWLYSKQLKAAFCSLNRFLLKHFNKFLTRY